MQVKKNVGVTDSSFTEVSRGVSLATLAQRGMSNFVLPHLTVVIRIVKNHAHVIT